MKDTGIKCLHCQSTTLWKEATRENVLPDLSGKVKLGCDCGKTTLEFISFEQFHIPEELRNRYKEAHQATLESLKKWGVSLREVDRSTYRKQQVYMAYNKLRSEGKVTWTDPELLFHDGEALMSRELERQQAETEFELSERTQERPP
jgi:hypothetical protein